jgi:hypothetical protein
MKKPAPAIGIRGIRQQKEEKNVFTTRSINFLFAENLSWR